MGQWVGQRGRGVLSHFIKMAVPSSQVLTGKSGTKRPVPSVPPIVP